MQIYTTDLEKFLFIFLIVVAKQIHIIYQVVMPTESCLYFVLYL